MSPLMGCVSKHRQKQKHGYSSLAAQREGAFIQDGTGITAGSLVIIFPAGWSPGSCCAGHCHGGSPRSQCHHSSSPAAAKRDPVPCRAHCTGHRQRGLLFQRVPFPQVSFCFVSVSPSFVWWGECIGPQKFIYHTVFFVLLARVG